MTSLERQQRGVLALLKQRPAIQAEDRWLESVSVSREIGMLREIALWWRRYQIEAQCRYTSRLLKRLGCFEDEAAKYFRASATSPYIEELALDFLQSLANHPDPLIRSVAAFESACLKLRAGILGDCQIVWDRDPSLTMAALDKSDPIPASEPGIAYVMKIDKGIASPISCEWKRVPAEAFEHSL